MRFYAVYMNGEWKVDYSTDRSVKDRSKMSHLCGMKTAREMIDTICKTICNGERRK